MLVYVYMILNIYTMSNSVVSESKHIFYAIYKYSLIWRHLTLEEQCDV